MKSLYYPKGCLTLLVPAASNFGWQKQGLGGEGAQLPSWGSVVEPVSVYARHLMVLYSNDREKRKRKAVPQQESAEYSGCSVDFREFLPQVQILKDLL